MERRPDLGGAQARSAFQLTPAQPPARKDPGRTKCRRGRDTHLSLAAKGSGVSVLLPPLDYPSDESIDAKGSASGRCVRLWLL